MTYFYAPASAPALVARPTTSAHSRRVQQLFHNGSAPTLDAVVQTYNTKKALGLSVADMADLVQYLKSL